MAKKDKKEDKKKEKKVKKKGKKLDKKKDKKSKKDKKAKASKKVEKKLVKVEKVVLTIDDKLIEPKSITKKKPAAKKITPVKKVVKKLPVEKEVVKKHGSAAITARLAIEKIRTYKTVSGISNFVKEETRVTVLKAAEIKKKQL